MILLDTSALVASLSGDRRAWPRLLALVQDGQLLRLPALVLFEFLRGPRHPHELVRQVELFPPHTVLPFTSREAEVSAQLYRQLARARGREVDITIAACALTMGASLWTLNRRDFADIPGLRLVS